MLLNVNQSLLLVIDVQQRLMPVMDNGHQITGPINVLAEAALCLDVPVWVTEQNPKALGATISALDVAARTNDRKNVKYFEKMHFSAVKDEKIRTDLNSLQKKQIIITGIESHVCVLQTALDLKACNFDVFVVSDGVTSRKYKDRECAIARLSASGVHIVNSEMVVFEWLQKAGTAAFRSLSKLIK